MSKNSKHPNVVYATYDGPTSDCPDPRRLEDSLKQGESCLSAAEFLSHFRCCLYVHDPTVME